LEAIEVYTGEEVERYSISESEYQAILTDSDVDLFKNGDYDWQKLLSKNENPEGWD
jgi:hypothetical protein